VNQCLGQADAAAETPWKASRRPVGSPAEASRSTTMASRCAAVRPGGRARRRRKSRNSATVISRNSELPREIPHAGLGRHGCALDSCPQTDTCPAEGAMKPAIMRMVVICPRRWRPRIEHLARRHAERQVIDGQFVAVALDKFSSRSWAPLSVHYGGGSNFLCAILSRILQVATDYSALARATPPASRPRPWHRWRIYFLLSIRRTSATSAVRHARDELRQLVPFPSPLHPAGCIGDDLRARDIRGSVALHEAGKRS